MTTATIAPDQIARTDFGFRPPSHWVQPTPSVTSRICPSGWVGVGLAQLPDGLVAGHIEQGELVQVLADWCEPFEGYHLYYPSRRQHTAAFRVVLDALRIDPKRE
jgi:DNA-binding transcriptional LysR family regulator